MKYHRFWKFALVFVLPLALYAFIAERNSWRPQQITPAQAYDTKSTEGITQAIEEIEFSPDGRFVLAKRVTVREHSNNSSLDFLLYDVASKKTYVLSDAFFNLPAFIDKSHLVGWDSRQDTKINKNQSKTPLLPQPLNLVTLPNGFRRLGVFSNSTTLFGTVDNTIPPTQLWTWDYKNNKAPQKWLCPKNKLLFSNCILLDDETLLISYGGDSINYDVWNIKTKKVNHLPELKNQPGELIGIMPDESWLISDNKGKVTIWDYKKHKPIRTIIVEGYSKYANLANSDLKLSPDGHFLYAENILEDYFDIWTVDTGKLLKRVHTAVLGIDFAPNKNTIATGDYNGNIDFWNIK